MPALPPPPLQISRLLVIALFVLGLVLQPVVGAAGEMHEFAHDPSGSHAHGLHGESAADPEVPPGTAKDGGTLHVLLHFAHCCGGTAAVLPGPGLDQAMATSAELPTLLTQRPPPPPLPAPYKPPISS